MITRTPRQYVIAAWNSSLELGVPAIDEQHHALVDLVNRLWSATINKSSKDEIVEILGELVNYTKSHFIAEEALMQVENYPKTKQHRSEHVAFIKKIATVKKMVAAGRQVEMELLQFLTDWLTNHIKGSDKEYAVFMLNKSKPGIFSSLWKTFKEAFGSVKKESCAV